MRRTGTVLRIDGRGPTRHAVIGRGREGSFLRTVEGAGPHRVRRRAAAIALAGGLLVLSGCAGIGAATPEPTATSTLPVGVKVALEQLRADVGPRQMQVRVTNGSDAPLEIGAVRVEDDRFDGPAERVIADRVSTLRPGSAVDIRVQLPPVDCTAPSEPASDHASTVVLELIRDGDATEVAGPASDSLGFLAPLHARECLMERVTDAAALAFTGFEPSAPGEAATLQLTITPTGDGAATIVGVEDTNLIEFLGIPTDEDLLPLGVDVEPGDTEPIVVELPIRPFRCDPHVVQEDKRGTVFDVRVELDGEPGQVELFVGEEMRGRILTWVADWCRFGSGG